MTAIVYRQLPNLPHRQYVRRVVVGTRWVLWHRDPHVALRMERNDAKALADALWLRSLPRLDYRAGPPPEPAGEYGVEDVTP